MKDRTFNGKSIIKLYLFSKTGSRVDATMDIQIEYSVGIYVCDEIIPCGNLEYIRFML